VLKSEGGSMKILKIFDKTIWILSIIVIFITFFSISLQVITRYVGLFIPEWTEELARYTLVWIVSLGTLIYLQEEGFRPSVELILNNLPVKVQRIVYISLTSLIIFFLFILFKYSLEMMLKNINSFSPAMRFPIKYVYFGLVVMPVLYLRYFLEYLYIKIKS
jgi:TRAP-type C4-dicarboxylate transport system permease small subunit